MPRLQCTRCLRVEPPSSEDNVAVRPRHPIEFGEADDDPLRNILGRPWASIDGRAVCPECQFAAERKGVAQRIVSAIENEIVRSDKTDTDPSAVEVALVPYAMQLREALSSDEASGSPADSHRAPESPTPKPGHIQLDVAITGAFLTGRSLRISIADYQKVQRTLGTNLSGQPGAGWRSTADESREGTYQSGGGFSSMLPLVVASCHGTDTLSRARTIYHERPAHEHDWLDRRIEGWAVKATSMRVDVYDLGMAVINGTFRVGVPAHLTLSGAAAELKRMVWLRPDAEDDGSSPITGMFSTLSKEAAKQFRDSVDSTLPDHQVQPPWTPASRSEPSAEWGRLLWLHPVHMLECEDPATRRWSARELAPTFSKTIKVPDGQLVSGIGWSAIVTDGDRSAFALPMKLVQLHWAYFALYMEIDRELLIVLDRNTSTTGSTLPQLECDAKTVFDGYIRVMNARARVDSALASLGGGEQAIWDAIADVQKFDTLVGGVDRKVDALQRIADRRVQQATSAAASRSATILGFLTTLTLVTLATTLLAYFYGGFSAPHNDPQPPLRWLFLIVGAALAVILSYFTFWRPRRKKRE